MNRAGEEGGVRVLGVANRGCLRKLLHPEDDVGTRMNGTGTRERSAYD